MNTIPTLHFPRSEFSEDFDNVYEPAEDSFLLLDALESDLETIRGKTSICLECGSGSGIISTALSKCLNQEYSNNTKEGNISHHNVLMITTDINEHACKTTLKCANFNHQDNMIVINTNLADGIVDRLENQIDLLLFNPPYVPTDLNEESSTKINLSWCGGKVGREVIDKFMLSYVTRLLSKPDGRLYLVALEQNNVPDLLSMLYDNHGIKGEIVLKRQCGIEKLFVLRFGWIKP